MNDTSRRPLQKKRLPKGRDLPPSQKHGKSACPIGRERGRTPGAQPRGRSTKSAIAARQRCVHPLGKHGGRTPTAPWPQTGRRACCETDRRGPLSRRHPRRGQGPRSNSSELRSTVSSRTEAEGCKGSPKVGPRVQGVFGAENQGVIRLEICTAASRCISNASADFHRVGHLTKVRGVLVPAPEIPSVSHLVKPYFPVPVLKIIFSTAPIHINARPVF